MTHDPIPPEIVPAAADFTIEWLCALLNEPDPEKVKARLMVWVMEWRKVDAETAWAWVAGREVGEAR